MEKLKWFKKTKGNIYVSKSKIPRGKITAWQKTIEKWELFLNDCEISERELESCGLCNVYNIDGSPACDGCPVYIKTSFKFCRKTPFDYYLKWRRWRRFGEKPKEKLHSLAQDELNFLKSVRDGQ